MRACLILYPSDIEGDDDRIPVKSGKSRSSERRTFRLLSSVCSYWHQTFIGWSESPTSQWVKHQIKKLIERKFMHTLCIGLHSGIVVSVNYVRKTSNKRPRRLLEHGPRNPGV